MSQIVTVEGPERAVKAPRAQLFVTDAGGDHTERIRWPKAGIQVYACTGASRHLPAAVGAFQVMVARRDVLPPRTIAHPCYQGQAWQPSCPQAKLHHSPEFARPIRGTNEYPPAARHLHRHTQARRPHTPLPLRLRCQAKSCRPESPSSVADCRDWHMPTFSGACRLLYTVWGASLPRVAG